MEAYEHFTISAIAGLLLVPLIIQDLNIVSFVFFWSCCVAAGTLIDLDHFLIATIRDKNLKEFKLALSNPGQVVTENNEALDDLIPNWSRYMSHFIILIAVPASIYLVSHKLAMLVFVMLSLHIICDIYRSVQERQEFFDKPWKSF